MVSAGGLASRHCKAGGALNFSLPLGRPADGLHAPPLTLRQDPQTLLSSTGAHRGAYSFTPTFTLTIPPNAFRSNYSGTIDGSPLIPYVSVIPITIS